MDASINKKIGTATKWSSITEICAKLVSPISSMVLARLLTPEAFGVVATINIIISFTDMFTDAGFQKYLIQHDFKSEEDREQSTTVAFWTNLAVSLFLWFVIIIFRNQLSALVGNPEHGGVLAFSCVVLPMTSFSSIQMALFKRDFDFKSLFYARIIGVCIPIFVTIPLAFWLRSYWALILGTIAKNLSDAIVLTARSKWKPKLFYDFSKLREMFAFSMWTLFEQISIWLTSYIGTFIVGIYLSSYYVGLYKTSMTTVSQFMTLITAATTPVLFSALSRLNKDKEAFEEMFLRFQRLVGMLIIPMSIGMYLYRDFITRVLLGSQWMEASMFVGLWGLTSSLGILLNNYCSEAYRALGKPKVSLFVQLIHLAFLIPSLIVSAKISFEALYWTRSLVRFQMYFCQLITLYYVTRISAGKICRNLWPAAVSGCVMALFSCVIQPFGDSMLWDTLCIALCVFVYFGVLVLFPSARKELVPAVRRVLNRTQKN